MSAFRNILILAVIWSGLSSSLWAKTSVEIRLGKGGDIEVTGLDKTTLSQLGEQKRPREQWLKLLSVRVAPKDAETADKLPALLGEYRLEKNVLKFVPRFPLAKGVRYRVQFNPAQLPSGSPDEQTIQKDLLIPRLKTKPTTVVEQVYPSTNRIPANLLKFYVHFSAPMSQGGSYYHVELLDPEGKPVKLPFLELDEELWSPDGKRFTLFFDPGRVKREVKPLVDLGLPLHEGKKQTLIIHSTWKDAQGNPLKASFRKTFTVVAPDRKMPVLKDWKLTPPAAGTTQPLKIAFDEPLEQALASRMIEVVDAEGMKIKGQMTVSQHETRWSFAPKQSWKPGTYTLVVDSELEDLAGNSMVKPFEVDLSKAPKNRDYPKILKRSFSIRKLIPKK